MPTALASQFGAAAAAVYAALLPIARNLFIVLAALDITWALLWWVLEKDDPLPLFVSLLRNLMRIAFFWFVLIHADTLSHTVLTSFRMAGQAAAQAAGAPVPSLDPSAVIGTGATLAGQIAGHLQVTGLLSSVWGSLAGLLVSALMFVAFLFIAAQMVIALIEAFVLMGAGVLLLGFLGSPWTARFGLTYFSALAGTGIKLFLIYVIVGFGGALVSGWSAQIAAGVGFVDALTIIGVALLFALVTWWIPNYAQALSTGAVSTTLQTAVASTAGIAATVAGLRMPLALGGRTTAALGQGAGLARDRYRAGAGALRALGAGVGHTVLSPFRATSHNLARRGPHPRMTAADALRRTRSG